MGALLFAGHSPPARGTAGAILLAFESRIRRAKWPDQFKPDRPDCLGHELKEYRTAMLDPNRLFPVGAFRAQHRTEAL